MAQYEMQYASLLPSQLLLGSPFQPGTPGLAQFPAFVAPSPATNGVSIGVGSDTNGGYVTPPYYTPSMDFQSRTIYLGNIPADSAAEEVLNHVRSGVVETIRMVPEKNCAFLSFLDHVSAAHFFADAHLKRLSIKGTELKIGWGRSSPIPAPVSLAITHDGASRNVYLGNLPDDITEDEIRNDVGRFGPIDCIKLIKEKNIAFVHFLSIGIALKCVTQLPSNSKWMDRKVNYGKDRCAYISKTQAQNAAQYLGINEHVINNVDRDMLSSALAQQSAAAVAVATMTGGGPSNIGNRTIYLGNIHAETSCEEICNVVRGGLLQSVRYIPEKHICFVTFIDSSAAAQFYALATYMGLNIHNRKLKIGWGKHSGPLHHAIALAVTAGATRNVYIGNMDDSSWPESKLRTDFSMYGEIEQVNFLPEKSCAFVNFTEITNAIKAIEGIREKKEYKDFKINFGKDRCGNSPRINQDVLNDIMGQYYERMQHDYDMANNVQEYDRYQYHQHQYSSGHHDNYEENENDESYQSQNKDLQEEGKQPQEEGSDHNDDDDDDDEEDTLSHTSESSRVSGASGATETPVSSIESEDIPAIAAVVKTEPVEKAVYGLAIESSEKMDR